MELYGKDKKVTKTLRISKNLDRRMSEFIEKEGTRFTKPGESPDFSKVNRGILNEYLKDFGYD